jgi:TP901 family phage tail tape measure protein
MAQTIGEIVTKLTADIGDHQVKLKQAQDQIRRLQGEAQKAQSRFAGMNKTLVRFAAGFVGVGVAVQGVRVLMRKMVADTIALDRAMGQVETLTDKSSAAFGVLTDQVQALSRVIPKSADDLGMGLYQTLSAGITDSADAMQVLEASAKLAASGLLDTATSVDAVTTVMNAYGIAAANVEDVTDAFFQTVKEGKITVGGLAAAVGTAATSAALAGVTIDDLGAAIATMTKLGIDANTTTTSLNRLFLSIVDATDETRAAAEALGIEWSTAALKAKGLSGFMREVAEATDGNVDALTALGLDLRAARSLFILAGQGAAEFARVQESFAGKAGATETAFIKTNRRIQAQWQLIKNQLSVEWTNFGQKVLPFVTEGLLNLTGNLEGATDRTIRLLKELGLAQEAQATEAINLNTRLQSGLLELEEELRRVGTIGELSMSQVAAAFRDIVRGDIGKTKDVLNDLAAALNLGTLTLDVELDRKKIQQQMDSVRRDLQATLGRLRLRPDDKGLRAEVVSLEKRRDRLGEILLLLAEYEKTQRDIRDNADATVMAMTGLSAAGVVATRGIRELESAMRAAAEAAPDTFKAGDVELLDESAVRRAAEGAGTFSAAMIVVSENMRAGLRDAQLFRAEMDKVGEEAGGDVARGLNLSALSYDQLRQAQQAFADAIASNTVALAFARTEEAASKVRVKLTEAEQAAAAVAARLADMPAPQIDFGALSADEFWEWYAQLQQDLTDNALELKLTVDGSEARAEAERIRAELEAQREAARAEMLRPGAGVTGPVALEADVNITGALEKFLGVDGLSTDEAQAKLDGLAESLGRALPAMTDVVGSLLVFDERIGQFVPAIDMSGVEERFAGLAEQLKQHAVVTRQIPNYWRTSLVQTDRVQESFRAGMKTATTSVGKWSKGVEAATPGKAGFFGGLKDRLFGAKDAETGGRAGGILDAKEFASNFAANIATGFTSSGLGDALFGGSQVKREREAHTKANTEALDNLSDRVRELGEALLSSPIGGIGKAVDAALARFELEFPQGRLDERGHPSRREQTREALFKLLDDELRRLGLTMSDVEELARSLDIEWKGWATDLVDLQKAIDALDWTEVFDTAMGKLGLLKREWDLFDFTPEQKLASLKDYVASNLTGDLKAAFDAVDWGDLDSVTAFWNAFTTGKFNAEDLNIPVDVFLDAVGDIENLADATDAAADGVNKFGDALRNVPSGFKVALRRFQADTGEMAKDAFSNLGGPETKPRTDLEGSVPGEPIVLKATSSFAAAVDTFSTGVGDALANELTPALQEFVAALKNPLTGVSVEVDADGLAQTRGHGALRRGTRRAGRRDGRRA